MIMTEMHENRNWMWTEIMESGFVRKYRSCDLNMEK